MTPQQIERATFLLKRLNLIRADIKAWAAVGTVKIAIADADADYNMSDTRPIVVTGESAKWVLSYAFESLKGELDAVESELVTLGVEFPQQRLIVGSVVFGAAPRAN